MEESTGSGSAMLTRRGKRRAEEQDEELRRRIRARQSGPNDIVLNQSNDFDIKVEEKPVVEELSVVEGQQAACSSASFQSSPVVKVEIAEEDAPIDEIQEEFPSMVFVEEKVNLSLNYDDDDMWEDVVEVEGSTTTGGGLNCSNMWGELENNAGQLEANKYPLEGSETNSSPLEDKVETLNVQPQPLQEMNETQNENDTVIPEPHAKSTEDPSKIQSTGLEIDVDSNHRPSTSSSSSGQQFGASYTRTYIKQASEQALENTDNSGTRLLQSSARTQQKTIKLTSATNGKVEFRQKDYHYEVYDERRTGKNKITKYQMKRKDTGKNVWLTMEQLPKDFPPLTSFLNAKKKRKQQSRKIVVVTEEDENPEQNSNEEMLVRSGHPKKTKQKKQHASAPIQQQSPGSSSEKSKKSSPSAPQVPDLTANTEGLGAHVMDPVNEADRKPIKILDTEVINGSLQFVVYYKEGEEEQVVSKEQAKRDFPEMAIDFMIYQQERQVNVQARFNQTLNIGRMAKGTTKKHIRDLIRSLNVIPSYVTVFERNNKPTAHAFVELASPEDATKCLQLANRYQQLNGTSVEITLREPHPSQQTTQSTTRSTAHPHAELNNYDDNGTQWGYNFPPYQKRLRYDNSYGQGSGVPAYIRQDLVNLTHHVVDFVYKQNY